MREIHYEMEVKIERGDTPAHFDKASDELRAIAFHQTSLAQSLFWLIKNFSKFATSSLLVPEDEINEFEFDVVHTFEVFQDVAELGEILLQNSSFSIGQLNWMASSGNKTPIYKGFSEADLFENVQGFIKHLKDLPPYQKKKAFESFNDFMKNVKSEGKTNG